MAILSMKSSESEKMISLLILSDLKLPHNAGIKISFQKEKTNYIQLNGNDMRYVIYSN